MTRNITHQQRIARDLNAAVGCGYQEALRRVRQAAAAGRLPTPLDAQGRAAAVHLLTREATTAGAIRTTPATSPLPTTQPPVPPRCLWPWGADAAALASLAPGMVTALVSLPTAGRSTLALNVALHNAQQRIGALFTSGEITSNALAQKVIAALYGFDVRSQVPPGGWETFKATAVPELDATPLLRHGARVGTSARDSLRAGLLAAARRSFTLRLWVVDSLWHFSDFTDQGRDTAATMAELRSLARAYNLAILVTSQVVTGDPDDPDVPVTAAHLPAGMADYSDRVLVLDRPGAQGGWVPAPYPSMAILRRVTGPGPAIELELEPEHCRFVSL
ncbi:AAA family ATPase [Streptomyces sp. ISL-36]|uniref:AAA family ATPase n=1 Tax=Streptomyces sp. ISL-36 TaxID=2819182 RepID=UPI001BE51ACE|nr:AAA family ATPase [Streptomyces sp. ISL-36]MBT2442543.1 AAA family ATPase [Streptomyces sp. ISL-36]